MPFPIREYDRLISLQEIWSVSSEDLYYVVESGLLRVCIWLPMRYMERGVMKDRKFVYEQHECREGFIGVRPNDCHQIFSDGRAKLRIFNAINREGNILRLAYEPPQPAITVRINDLVVLKRDREQFEQNYEISAIKGNIGKSKSENIFFPSDDYRYIKYAEHEFHFGDVQARVIELLHDASRSQRPWVHSKTLIHTSGSNAVRIRDLFKRNPGWEQMIISNGKGYYRLNIPLQEFAANKFEETQSELKKSA